MPISCSDWSNLPNELLELIVRRLDPVHYYRFSATCKSWQSTAMSKQYPLPHQVPWLMLSKHDDETDAHSFFSLFLQKECWLKVPDLRGKRCCGSSHGWLITIDHHTLQLHLLNPFSRRQIELPPPKSFPRPTVKSLPHNGVHFIEKVVLSEDPSLTDDYVAMAIVTDMKRLAFFRPQKEGKWVVIDDHPDRHTHCFHDIIFYKRQFFALSMNGCLMVVKIDPRPKLISMEACLPFPRVTCNRYLVEWSGELLQLRRKIAYDDEPFVDSSDDEIEDFSLADVHQHTIVNGDGKGDINSDSDGYDDEPYVDSSDSESEDLNRNAAQHPVIGNRDVAGDVNSDSDDSDYEEVIKLIYRTSNFKVYKLIDMKRWKRVKSLGDCMLFLGDNATISFSATDLPGSKGNRIYFTDDYWVAYQVNDLGCRDLGIFDLEDRTIEPFCPETFHSPLSPPIWITPNL